MEAFKELLAAAGVGGDDTWDAALRRLIHDARYNAIPSVAERKAVFTEWVTVGGGRAGGWVGEHARALACFGGGGWGPGLGGSARVSPHAESGLCLDCHARPCAHHGARRADRARRAPANPTAAPGPPQRGAGPGAPPRRGGEGGVPADAGRLHRPEAGGHVRAFGLTALG